ncbi:YidB family protein [Pantoea sp. FN060301]|uniref:YidB family protein n=1 Tax=Pantoea sp. FN060301 TaxID=3420380 RepID=UPI003D184943
MSMLEKVLGMCGLSNQTTQEVNGVIEWVEQQGGIQALVNRLQSGEFSDIVQSWLSDRQNVALSSEIVQKMIGSEAIEQLAAKLGINTPDALNLLAKYLPQLVDKSSSSGAVDTNTDLALIVNKLSH